MAAINSLAYWLGANRLYLQVTSKFPPGCLTLFHARGPGFKLPEGFKPISEEPEADDLADCVEWAYENDQRKLTAAKIGMGVSFLAHSRRKAGPTNIRGGKIINRKAMRAWFLLGQENL